MKIIKEGKKQNETFYRIDTYNQNNMLIHTKDIYLKSVIVEMENNITYFILYDENMVPIRYVFRFLNYELDRMAINSREKSLHALKLLYVFSEIIDKDIINFNKSDISNLINFLRGFSSKGQEIMFELITIRNSETINGYLSVYRNYMKYLNANQSPFLSKVDKEVNVLTFENGTDMTITPYVLREKTPFINSEVPMYISVDEFRSILSFIRKDYSKREECIIRLMFQCGLRIGEVLGLTADDLVIEKVKDDYVAVGYLRNRLTDKKDQMAKTCMKVISKKQYRLKDYNTKNRGFQKIIIPMDLYDLINDYIEEVHIWARENKHDNYYKYTIADRVRKADEYEDVNYYIFLNSQGKPLLSHFWNYTLRGIFKKANIYVDTNVRRSNLNHRFRHGFAMYQVKYLNVKILELKEKLRHKSLSSVSVYYQPTIADQIDLKDKFINDLYSIIPELDLTSRKGIN